MPRANRRRDDAARPELGRATVGPAMRQPYAGSQWFVRRVAGAGSGAPYRCPGCQQQLGGIPHVVVWPAEGIGGLEDRRHWHLACWAHRETRPPRGSYR
ncbi:MAG: hypothetical protein WAR57_06615 [Candidatus Phosphoribacter sp.]|nr:hypothetical protein [Actinomycetales bacterium]